MKPTFWTVLFLGVVSMSAQAAETPAGTPSADEVYTATDEMESDTLRQMQSSPIRLEDELAVEEDAINREFNLKSGELDAAWDGRAMPRPGARKSVRNR